MRKIIFIVFIVVFISLNVTASEVKLQTIGAATGSNLVLMYVSLGMSGDAYMKNVYTKDEIKGIVSMLIGQISLMNERLDKLIESKELPSEDQVFVEEIVKIFKVLKKQGNALLDYIKTGKEAKKKQFDKYRKESQSKISELLSPKKK